MLQGRNARIFMIKMAIEYDHDSFLAHFNAANLYFEFEQFDFAMKHYNKVFFLFLMNEAVELQPNDESALMNRGVTQLMLHSNSNESLMCRL